jgi:hypothetical protein
MKIELSTYEVADRLLNDEFAGWTHEEALALAEYYEQREEDTGEEITFNACSIRCDWNSYSNMQEVRNAYPNCPKDDDDALEWLYDHAQVIHVDSESLLVTQF